MTRVVSLVPSSTETLLALGADVVACTRFCEQPGMTTVGGTKNPDIDAIVALAPDVVVMDVEENRREDADALEARGLRLVATDVCSLADAIKAVTVLADAADVSLPESWAAAVQTAGAAAARGWSMHQSALVPIWRRPWMALGSGTYGASLLEHLGIAVTVPSGSTGKYPAIELDDPTLSPDLVLVPSEPYAFKPKHVDELSAAFPDAVVFEIDGQDLFWWGSRTPAAIDRLAAAIGAALSPWVTSRPRRRRRAGRGGR